MDHSSYIVYLSREKICIICNMMSFAAWKTFLKIAVLFSYIGDEITGQSISQTCSAYSSEELNFHHVFTI
jgi:hypothetical protein